MKLYQNLIIRVLEEKVMNIKMNVRNGQVSSVLGTLMKKFTSLDKNLKKICSKLFNLKK